MCIARRKSCTFADLASTASAAALAAAARGRFNELCSGSGAGISRLSAALAETCEVTFA